ncbi:MAG: T9SS type A sorting domain-containing protein [Bacteroidetes bacterium]|nr:MAG: T9SS type A sorting domain-containing protein [Bacteroidota bacterium]
MKTLLLILFVFDCVTICFGQIPPTNLLPQSGSYETPPTFSFITGNVNGCYILVVSNDISHCSTNGTGLDIVHSFGAISANTYASYAPNSSEWNKLSNGSIYWHISWRETAPCEPPYPYYTECISLNKTITHVEDKLPNLFSDVSIYPNPFDNELIIKFYADNENLDEIKVFNVLGSEIELTKQIINNLNTINIKFNSEPLKPGLYYIRIKLNSKIITKKVIKY